MSSACPPETSRRGLVAESGNPRNDVIWALSLTNMLDPRILALTENYVPKGFERIPAQFKEAQGKWFAVTGYMAALCVNLDRLKQKNLPVPTGWKDLTNPIYKGEIVMPNPESSGTGYLQIVSLIQGMGTDAGWKMLKELDKNVAQYPQSGPAPCKMASKGEFAIGASLAEAAIKTVKEDFPVKMVIPVEGAGFELGANALMASSKNKADAKRFLDWTLTPNAVEAYSSLAEFTDFSERMKAAYRVPLIPHPDMISPLGVRVETIVAKTLKGNPKNGGAAYRRVVWLSSAAAFCRLESLVNEKASSVPNIHQVEPVENGTYGGNIMAAGLLIVDDFIRTGTKVLGSRLVSSFSWFPECLSILCCTI